MVTSRISRLFSHANHFPTSFPLEEFSDSVPTRRFFRLFSHSKFFSGSFSYLKSFRLFYHANNFPTLFSLHKIFPDSFPTPKSFGLKFRVFCPRNMGAVVTEDGSLELGHVERSSRGGGNLFCAGFRLWAIRLWVSTIYSRRHRQGETTKRTRK